MLPAQDERLIRLRIDRSPNDRLMWTEGEWFSLPAALVEWARTHAPQRSTEYLSLPAEPLPNADALAHRLRMRAAFTPTPPTSTRLPFSYRTVPSRVRHGVARAIGRWQRHRTHVWAAFPGWPESIQVRSRL